MKHQSTRALYDYWTTKRGSRRAPARSDIDPADIRRILADTFILTADFVNDIRVRLAGTRVCALFAREIKGEAFEDLWSEPSREQMHGLLAAVIDENVGAVAGVTWAHGTGRRNRSGVAACCRSPLMAGPAFARLAYWRPWRRPIGSALGPWSSSSSARFRHVGAYHSNCRRSALRAGSPRRLARGTAFVVYSGGRESPSGKHTG